MMSFKTPEWPKMIFAIIIICMIALGFLLDTPTVRKRFVKQVEILRVSHGIVQHNEAAAEWGSKGKPMWTALSPYHVGFGFIGLDTGDAVIYYVPDRNAYRIYGNVKVCYPNGVTAVVKDTDIKAPGPRQHPPKDGLSELIRCRRMWRH